MQKVAFFIVVAMLSGIAQSVASENAPPAPAASFQIDVKRQIRVPTPVKIKKAIDATTLLGDDGQIYALVGLDIPDDNDTAVRTQKRLAELTEGKKCTLYQTRSDKVGRLDRMNHILGHLVCGVKDIWIQGTLLSEGLARVRTTPENREQAASMLALESTARKNKQALWALPVNKALTPQTARERINGFGIVEGQIYTTAQNRNSVFLNFTSDWKTDFSIGIPSKLRKDFSKNRIDPMSLRGKKIRVRGWIQNYNGAYIELDHAEQLEILVDAEQPKPTENKVTDIIEKVMDAAPQEKPQERKTEKQFMHTISGPSAPVVESPKQPDVKKVKDDKAD